MKTAQIKKLISEKGFTLVELLVVIGILGILAAGLLATIDPLEQLRKGRDTTYKSIAIEVNNALLRYYATNGYYPWNAPTPCSPAPTTGSFETLASMNNTGGCIEMLIGSGELKRTFNTQSTTDLARISVGLRDSGVTGQENTVVCFQPESKSENQSSQSDFDEFGTAGAGGLWCAQ